MVHCQGQLSELALYRASMLKQLTEYCHTLALLATWLATVSRSQVQLPQFSYLLSYTTPTIRRILGVMLDTHTLVTHIP